MILRPPTEYDYHSVAERFSACGTQPQRLAALQAALTTYNLETIAYLADRIPGRSVTDPYIAVTYSDTWVDRYKRNGYYHVDPVIKTGFRSMLPADWRSFDMSDRRIAAMYGEAREHGLGRNGLSIPIRGQSGERGVLSITTRDGDREWESCRRIYMRDFMILATHLHQSIVEAEGAKNPPVQISEREIECLKWAAAGKTHADIATILTISHHTVRAHLDTARNKLNAVNLPHAVAQAFTLGII